MKISNQGYLENCITLENNSGTPVEVGDLVSVGDDFKAVKAADGDLFTGLCVAEKNGLCTVQTHGYMEIPAYDDDIEPGVNFLAVQSGAAAEAARGRCAIVLGRDTEKIRIILN